MTSRKQGIYESDNKEFIFAPATGVKLNPNVFCKPTLSDSKDATKLTELINFASSLSEVSRFSSIHQNTQRTTMFIKEYFDSYKEDNSHHKVFIQKDKVSLPYIKSIHSILANSLNSRAWTKDDGVYK
ncbi:hypothetical protein [Photobacterium kishitanii]|uniref:Uncharacterized protein n=1 Tax=Photobacterium kishitanii TaxID=318456 RepID=A0A2T3KAZ0_9GAMM|nr:hypothetical protein [Photobacterium kishitanii]PSU89770.1 hypothetical protein C9J27_24115 [Photobacterium kishitanii]